jgi:hypothetical protein
MMLSKKLLSHKGVFCYDNVSDIKKLETTELPPKEEFHSKLYDEPISDKKYQHAKTGIRLSAKIWVNIVICI